MSLGGCRYAVDDRSKVRGIKSQADAERLAEVPGTTAVTAEGPVRPREYGNSGHGDQSGTGPCPACRSELPHGPAYHRRRRGAQTMNHAVATVAVRDSDWPVAVARLLAGPLADPHGSTVRIQVVRMR